jgi:ribose-phosphate pyrophosphokinase
MNSSDQVVLYDDRKNTSNVYLCSKSILKYDITQQLFNTFTKQTKQEYIIVTDHQSSSDTIQQPINEGTFYACQSRILSMVNTLENLKIELKDHDYIIAFENGIYTYNNTNIMVNPIEAKQCYDICVMIIYDQMTKKMTRYNSFGIQIDVQLFNAYINSKDIKFINDVQIGYTKTFGEYLHNKFNISATNWMQDPRFGNIDRLLQMKDCCNKYLLDHKTQRILNYPKEGIIFKHMTPILINPFLLDTLFTLLERFVRDNYDVDKIDYFAGLDARGFYIAPTLARIFKKGFIPIRKASKIPKDINNKLATSKYITEYSVDEFALEESTEYLPVNGIMKNAVVVDDLLATGGSVGGAASVLRSVGINVLSVLTVYDVPELRDIAEKKLLEQKIDYKVLINENGVPNDFSPLKYNIPNSMLIRLTHEITDNVRRYTLTDDEWDDPFVTCATALSNTQKPSGIFHAITENSFHTLKIEETRRERQEICKKVGIIFTNKDRNLAEEIHKKMPDLQKIHILADSFSNGEARVQLESNVRNMHVIIISQIRTGNVDKDIIELFLIMDACLRAGSAKITVVLPYYVFSRSDKKEHPRCPIAAARIAELLKCTGIDNLITLDLHAGQIAALFDKGCHNLYIGNYLCDDIYNNYLRFIDENKWNDQYIIVSPDAGSLKTGRYYANKLKINYIAMDKCRDYSKPGTVMSSRFIGSPDEFKNKIAFMIDDMADTFGTMCAAAKVLVENGAKYVIVLVSHGILSGDALNKINNTPYIEEVVVTDSLPQEHNLIKCPKLRVITCSELMARAIDGVLSGRSISRLF